MRPEYSFTEPLETFQRSIYVSTALNYDVPIHMVAHPCRAVRAARIKNHNCGGGGRVYTHSQLKLLVFDLISLYIIDRCARFVRDYFTVRVEIRARRPTLQFLPTQTHQPNNPPDP